MVRPLLASWLTLAALAAPVDDEGPPPGSAADLSLWRAGRAVTEEIVVQRSRAGTLQVSIGSHKLLERLAAAAERAGPRSGPALLAVRERLLKAWQRDYHVVTRQWPVDPTRGCGYPVLAFDSALRIPPGEDGGVLGSARGELRDCVDKALGAIKALADANRALEAARAEAERALRPRGEEDERHEQHERHEAAEGAREKGGE